MHVRFLPGFAWLEGSSPSGRNRGPQSGCSTVYPSPAGGRPGCFRVLAALPAAAVNSHVRAFVGTEVQLLWVNAQEHDCWTQWGVEGTEPPDSFQSGGTISHPTSHKRELLKSHVLAVICHCQCFQDAVTVPGGGSPRGAGVLGLCLWNQGVEIGVAPLTLPSPDAEESGLPLPATLLLWGVVPRARQLPLHASEMTGKARVLARLSRVGGAGRGQQEPPAGGRPSVAMLRLLWREWRPGPLPGTDPGASALGEWTEVVVSACDGAAAAVTAVTAMPVPPVCLLTTPPPSFPSAVPTSQAMAGALLSFPEFAGPGSPPSASRPGGEDPHKGQQGLLSRPWLVALCRWAA